MANKTSEMLDPYRESKIAQAMEGERTVHRITFTPSSCRTRCSILRIDTSIIKSYRTVV